MWFSQFFQVDFQTEDLDKIGEGLELGNGGLHAGGGSEDGVRDTGGGASDVDHPHHGSLLYPL